MGLSSNILWHQTNYLGLRAILRNKMLRYSYCKEDIFKLVDGETIAIPMISVCDLPFSELNSSLGKYGSCTIGFDVNWGVKKKFNPVWYCESHSLILEQINKTFTYGLENDDSEHFVLAYSILSYIKPKEGKLSKHNYKNYRFYDEREFRRCPMLKSLGDRNIKPF